MNTYVISAHLKDAFRPGRIVTIAVIAVIVVLFGLVWNRVAPSLSPGERYSQLAPIIIYRITALIAAVASMGVFAQEVEQQTLVYLLSRPIPRWWLILGRSIASLIYVIACAWTAVLAAGLVLMGGSAFTSPMIWIDLLVVAAAAFAYGALFVTISLMMNRAMIACLIFAFGWETFAQNLEGMSRLSLLTYMNAAAAHFDLRAKGVLTFLAGDMTFNKPPAWVAWCVLLGVGVAFTFLSMWLMEQLQYSPREDAE